jgi:hypothetical protein
MLGTALRWITAPYARGAATLDLVLGPALAGVSDVFGYDFQSMQTRFGLQSNEVSASYVLTLRSDQLDSAAIIEIDYVGSDGPGTLQFLVPAGSLAGASFLLAPLPKDPSLVLVRLKERPAPGPNDVSGPDKWAVTALLGHAARLLWTLTTELQSLAATTRDVKAQSRLATARGGSLDAIGQGLGIARLPPAPYRLDFDHATVALYHFDDPVAPVIDATRDYPGVSLGVTRGKAGRFGGACQVTPGGVVLGDAAAFNIDPATGFCVEMFVNFAAAISATQRVIFAIKRPRADQIDSTGWSLSLDPTTTGHDLAFAVTDAAGVTVRAAALNFAAPAVGSWTHLAAVINPVTDKAVVFANGASVAEAPLGTLGFVATAANIGLGSDSTGAPRFNGLIDEVRFSNSARSDFSSVLGANGKPYAPDANTIALYHFDETDDWIDEDRGSHFSLNTGGQAQRGVPGRFGYGLLFSGDPLPQPRCASERSFQAQLRSGAWNRSSGGAPVSGPYARFGYRQGAISVPGLDNKLHSVLVNDQASIDPSVRGMLTTACYGFTPDDPTNSNDPAQTISKFQAAGRSVREAIDYFGEWRGLGKPFFSQQYSAHGITDVYEPAVLPPSSPTLVQIPASADFVFDSGTSFTVEAFIRPDSISDACARAILSTRNSALLAGDVNANEAGWALTLGFYHSIANNLRFVVGDPTGVLVAVTADINMADGPFHHVAGVVDRDIGIARLYVDGVEVRQAPLGALDAASGPGPIMIGNCPQATAPFSGTIDEVRISRTARRQFQPALGESDVRYRQRLAIYRPARLPTFPAIRQTAQALTSVVASATSDVTNQLLSGDAPPQDLVQFDVDETDSTRFCASQWFRVIPNRLAAGQSIAADGTTPASEPATTGLKPLAPGHPALVSVPNGANYSFAGASGSGLMSLAAAQALERFAARLAALAPTAALKIESAYVAPPPTPVGPIAATVARATGGGAGLNEVQTLSADAAPSGAGFALIFAGQSTAPILFTGTAADVQSALEALSTIGAGNVVCSGGPLSGRDVMITFVGTLGYSSQPLISVAASTPATNDNLARALVLSLSAGPANLDTGVLGALAFEIGIDYAAYQTTQRLRLVLAPTQDLELAVGTTNNTGRDPDNRQIAIAGEPLSISIQRPQLKAIAGVPPQIEWSLLPGGEAAGTLIPVASDPTKATLTGQACGAATVVVRYTLPDGVTVLYGSLAVLIAPKTLDGADVLGGDGTPDVAEVDASGAPDADFRPEYLITLSDPRVDAGSMPRRMQLPLETALLRLADLVAKEPGAPRLSVLSAYDSSATTLESVGRGVVIAPSSTALSAGRLAALAFVAGFSYVERRRYPPSVYVSVPAGDRFEIVSCPLKRLWPNARISGTGVFMAAEFDTAGPPDQNFNPSQLQDFNDARADFGALSKKVQASLALALTALLNALQADQIAPPLKIVSGYVPGAANLQGVGRALLARHPNVPADRLAGYALQAKFGFVRHDAAAAGGPAVYMAAYASGGAPLSVLASPASGNNYVDVYVDALNQLAIRPALVIAGGLDWSVEPACPAAAELTTALREPSDPPGISERVLQGTAAGALAAVATLSLQDFSEPYQFRIRPATGVTAPRISKNQYDDLMNFFDAFHPVGTEAVTRQIRQFVHGFKRPPRWDRMPTEETFQHYRTKS